jgi:hypothetical protein
VGSAHVHLVHGWSPRRANEFFFEDGPPDVFEGLAAMETNHDRSSS